MGPTVLRIVTMTNQDPEFYSTMGPFLSRRAIVAENGAPIWDEDGKEWFIARLGRKVVGFAALKASAGPLSFVSAYVLPEHRRQGVYRALIAARVEAASDRGLPLKATATPASVPALKRAGFVAHSSRGQFTVMVRS